MGWPPPTACCSALTPPIWRPRRANAHYAEDVANMTKNVTEFIGLTAKPELKDIAQKEILEKVQFVGDGTITMFNMVEKGDLAGADTLYREQLMPVVAAIGVSGQHLSDMENLATTKYAEEAQSSVAPARYLNLFMIVLSFAVGTFFVYSIHGINSVLSRSAEDLTEGSDQVSSAATQVSSSSQSLAKDTSEQAAMIEETSASAEEINSMAKH